MKNFKQRLEISKWQSEINHQRNIVALLRDRVELIHSEIGNNNEKKDINPYTLLSGLQKEELELQDLLNLLNEQIVLLKDTSAQPDQVHSQIANRVKQETQAFGEIKSEYHSYMKGFFSQITYPHLQ